MSVAKKYRHPARGGVFIEAAFTLPLLILLACAIAQIGAALSQYLALGRIAYEGARYGISTPGLVADLHSDADCDPKVSGCNLAAHKIRTRIASLLTENRYNNGEIVITTERRSTSDDTTKPQVFQVSIRVRAPFEKRFFPFDFMPKVISSTVVAPYLFPDTME